MVIEEENKSVFEKKKEQKLILNVVKFPISIFFNLYQIYNNDT